MQIQRRAARGVLIGLAAVAFAVGAWQVREQLILARERARRSSCLSNVKSVGLAFAMYLRDHDDTMPPSEQPDDPYFWVPYILGDQMNGRPRYFGMSPLALLCPSDLYHEDGRVRPQGSAAPSATDPFAQIVRDPARYVDYEADPLLAGRSVDDLSADEVVLLWDIAPVHLGGRCYCHLDGRAHWLEEGDFERALADSRRLLEPAPR